MRVAKYLPRGGRFVTAAYDPVWVWDSNDSHLLVDIKVHIITPDYNSGLLWFNNHLFVVSSTTIKELDASTGSVVSEWPVPESDETSCIALPQHGEFIAYSTQSTVTFWDTSTHTELGLIQHPQGIRSIVLTPDERFLVIGGGDGKITIQSLSHITVSMDDVSLGYGVSEQILLCQSHFHIGFNPIDSSAPHPQGT